MAGFAVIRALALALLMATPASADVAEAVGDVILPAYDRLADATADLDRTAQADCAPQALHPGFAAVWDAWAAIDFLRIGPVEQDGRALAISFWPDPKASGPRAQQALIDAAAPAVDDPAAFADLSVAVRGLSGLERLVYPSPLTGDADYLCRLRRATAADLARMAAEVRAEWDGYAARLLEPGGPGNTDFLTQTEARAALFTQVATGLTALADKRLGRPLGSFDAPRPERAEAVASGRSLANVTRSLTGLRDMALALYPDAPRTRAAFDRAIGLAERLDDPVFAGVADPSGRLKVEILQQAVQAARAEAEVEIGGGLGLSVGFNAQDGD
ncbi:imelysin family protein [Paracoccus luteus]|uniref:imelysin family protein n=1 Tax=Paracoccus luteus TaxID=2508543 RepID=UPI00107037B3|nr:imelysin family protein [Paracoccus luteus]